MASGEWYLQQQLATLLPLDDGELKQILDYANSLPEEESVAHLKGLLGDTRDAGTFIATYIDTRAASAKDEKLHATVSDVSKLTGEPLGAGGPTSSATVSLADDKARIDTLKPDEHDLKPKQVHHQLAYAPPLGRPPIAGVDSHQRHTNPVIEAARIRSQDEVGTFQPSTISAPDRPIARNAEHAAEPSTAIRHLQYRNRTRARDGLSLQLPDPPISVCEVQAIWRTGNVVASCHVPR